MSKQELIEKTVKNLQLLPANELSEINDFVEFLLSRIQKKVLSEEVTQANLSSKSYKFLEEDKDIYTVSDLKEKYGQ